MTDKKIKEFTYRMVVDRPLSYEEVDNNLRRVEQLHDETEKLYEKTLKLHDKIKKMRPR